MEIMSGFYAIHRQKSFLNPSNLFSNKHAKKKSHLYKDASLPNELYNLYNQVW